MLNVSNPKKQEPELKGSLVKQLDDAILNGNGSSVVEQRIIDDLESSSYESLQIRNPSTEAYSTVFELFPESTKNKVKQKKPINIHTRALFRTAIVAGVTALSLGWNQVVNSYTTNRTAGDLVFNNMEIMKKNTDELTLYCGLTAAILVAGYTYLRRK